MTARTLYPNGPMLDEQGNLNPAWQQVFTLWGQFVTAEKQSGATANRPTTGLWVGRRYFDTTLNLPVFVAAIGPPVVWRNSAGLVA